jgi:hypothetical protein
VLGLVGTDIVTEDLNLRTSFVGGRGAIALICVEVTRIGEVVDREDVEESGFGRVGEDVNTVSDKGAFEATRDFEPFGGKCLKIISIGFLRLRLALLLDQRQQVSPEWLLRG